MRMNNDRTLKKYSTLNRME